jgi:hypothetical protein
MTTLLARQKARETGFEAFVIFEVTDLPPACSAWLNDTSNSGHLVNNGLRAGQP